MKLYIAIDVGGTKVAFGLFNEQRELLGRCRLAADSECTAEQFADKLARNCADLARSCGHELADIEGIGMAVPCYIDYATGLLPHVTNLPMLSGSKLGALLSERAGVPVLLENDCNAAGWGEARTGAGRDFDSIVYITVSTGIGGGIIINDRPLRGAYGGAGEVGHLLLTPGEGALCGCGNRGCFESYCGGINMYYHLQKDFEAGVPTTMFADIAGLKNVNGRVLEEAAKAGDPLALRHIDRMGKYLGILCYDLYQVLNINCYVFGGGMSNMGEFLIGRIRDSFNEWNNNSTAPVYFFQAEHGNDVGLYGAVELFLDK